MGKPNLGYARLLYGKNIAIWRKLGELKHLSSRGKEIKRDSLSSGERKGIKPKPSVTTGGVVGPQHED